MKKYTLLLLVSILTINYAFCITPLELKNARRSLYEWTRNYNIDSELKGRSAISNFTQLFQSEESIIFNDYLPDNSYNFDNPYLSAIDYAHTTIGKDSANYEVYYSFSGIEIVSEILKNDIIEYTITIDKEVRFDGKNNNIYNYPHKTFNYTIILEYNIENEEIKAQNIKLTDDSSHLDEILVYFDNTDSTCTYSNMPYIEELAEGYTTPLTSNIVRRIDNFPNFVEIKTHRIKNSIGLYGGYGISNTQAAFNTLERSDNIGFSNTITKISNYSFGLSYYRELLLKNNKHRLGIEIGIEYLNEARKYNSSYYDQFDEIDQDGGEYLRIISTDNYNEIINRGSIAIPITLKYEYFVNKNISIFGKLGIIPSYDLYQTVSCNGDFLYQGYYDWLFGVTIDQNGIYDFGNFNLQQNAQNTAIDQFALYVTTDVGANYYFNKFSVGASVNYSNNIYHTINSTEDYHLSKTNTDWQSLTYSLKNINTNNINFKIQFNYLF